MNLKKTSEELEIERLLNFNDEDLGLDVVVNEYSLFKNWVLGSNHRCRILLHYLKYKRGTIPDVTKMLVNHSKIINLSEQIITVYVREFYHRSILLKSGKVKKADVWVINLNNKLIFNNQKDLIISCMERLGMK